MNPRECKRLRWGRTSFGVLMLTDLPCWRTRIQKVQELGEITQFPEILRSSHNNPSVIPR